MKILLFILFAGCLLGAEPHDLNLTYKEGQENEYGKQIQAAFTQLLTSDLTLAKEFLNFEAAPPENAQGRYSGKPIILPIVISEEEHADFQNNGGTRRFKNIIAIYYRFDEGVHHGSETRSGFFALFSVIGTLSYRHQENDEFELTNANVVAEFKGFSRTLATPAPDVDENPE